MSHADILDDRDSLRTPILGSLILHVCLFALIPLYAWYQATYSARFGSQSPVGGGLPTPEMMKSSKLKPFSYTR